MKYQRVNASFKNIWNSSMSLQIDMQDENGGWTIEEWQQNLVQNLRPYVTNIDEWYLSYFVAMDVKK